MHLPALASSRAIAPLLAAAIFAGGCSGDHGTPTQPGNGTLAVTVSGLPSGTSASVTLMGPGGYSATQQYDASDHRSRWNIEQRKVWASAYELFSGIKGRTDSPAQFALRFCLSFDAVSSVIPGMLTRAHVEENAAASNGPAFGAAEIRRIGDIYHSHRFFVGR